MTHFYQQLLTEHVQGISPTHPFYATKQQAFQAFQKLGLPTSKDESYKYTPITHALQENFAPQQGTPFSITPTATYDVDKEDARGAYRIVLINGKLCAQRTTLTPHTPSIKVLTFREAQQAQDPVFLAHFAQNTLQQTDAFAAGNTVLFEEGLFIHIAAHATIDQPIALYHCTSEKSPQPITHPRLLIVMDRHSQASIVNTWQTIGFTNAMTEVVLKDHAQLDYYTLQTDLANHHYQVNTLECQQARNSILNSYTFTWSGAIVRNNIYNIIDASHSTTNMYGLYCLRAHQHVDNFTVVDHRQPHTYSHELYKGILQDAATGVFNGRIYVRTAAQKTNAFQTNRNLMLSDHAIIHTKPQLEIWADDVRCSHGATVGQLDEAQLFYLRTRGIPESLARHLLCQAFASEVIAKVPLEALQTKLYTSLREQAISCNT